jgi:uncharacterized cupredoxin-like copper-binding protein
MRITVPFSLARCCAALTTAALLSSGADAGEGHAHGSAPAAAAHQHDHSAAIGVAGDPGKASRTVDVDMTDNMRFTPDSVDVKQGETIRFVVKNSGRLKHEFVLGTDHALKEHYELMKKFPEMEHSDPNQVTVQPGKTGEVVWRFTKTGKVAFACLQPGHYDAGMKGVVKVAGGKAGITTPAKSAAAPMSDGEVRKVDKENQKITMKHGEIKNLGMPGMTMVFKVKDPALLDKLQPGDKVRFAAERADGSIVVTQIEAAK